MCCNRTNSNVLGATNRRRCCCRCNDNVLGVSEIALRGPGCISGTGRCGRFTAEFVEGESGFENGCSRVSPIGSLERNRCDCCSRCLRELLADIYNPITCPR